MLWSPRCRHSSGEIWSLKLTATVAPPSYGGTRTLTVHRSIGIRPDVTSLAPFGVT
jgi:hypothetical protein